MPGPKVLMHPLDEMDASYCFLAGHCQNEEVSAQTTAKQGIEICDSDARDLAEFVRTSLSAWH